jgi:hypothetical protein
MATVLDPPASPGDLLQGDRGDSRLTAIRRCLPEMDLPARLLAKLESKTVRLINADDPLHGIGPVVMIGAPGPPASRRFACARPPATKDG